MYRGTSEQFCFGWTASLSSQLCRSKNRKNIRIFILTFIREDGNFNMKIIKRRVSMIFHSENYGCQIGTGACRNLCPVQIHPGGFSAALENQIICGLCPQEFGAITATHIPQTGSGNLIPSFCQKGDKSIISTGSICNHLRMLPIFSFFCVVKHHRWYSKSDKVQ